MVASIEALFIPLPLAFDGLHDHILTFYTRCTQLQATYAWFLEIVFVHVLVRMCVFVCLAVCLPQGE